jgi:DICT domain-containing protein
VRRVTAEVVTETMSLFAELRRRHPELTPQLLSKPSLVAMSHAIEDECCARAEAPVLFGGFQRGRFLRESYARWVELARTAKVAVVFADIAEPGPVVNRAPVEVFIPVSSPLRREWLVVCDAVDHPACMVAFERPGQDGGADSQRRFEVLWSVDPRVVREAARTCAGLAEAYRPGWRTRELPLLEQEPAPASADLRRAEDLLSRTLGYLDASR